MRISLWPQSLFSRLIAALIIAVVLAQAASLYLFARDRERFVLDSSVREWSRRITEVTLLLEQLPPDQRAATLLRLKEQARRLAFRRERRALRPHKGPLAGGPLLLPPIEDLPGRPPPSRRRRSWPRIFIQLPFASDVEGPLKQQLRQELGAGYPVTVSSASAPDAQVIAIPSPFLGLLDRPTQAYDVLVRLPDSSRLVYRVTRVSPGAPLPRSLMVNLILLVAVLVIAL